MLLLVAYRIDWISCYAFTFFSRKPYYNDSRLQNIRFSCVTAYHLVKLIIPVCEKAKISVSQLFGSDFQELGKILFGNFSLELKL